MFAVCMNRGRFMRKHSFALGTLLLFAVFTVAGFIGRPLPVTAAQTSTGTIAYVVPNDTTGDQIWIADANGSNARPIYNLGVPDPYQVHGISGLAWKPD